MAGSPRTFAIERTRHLQDRVAADLAAALPPARGPTGRPHHAKRRSLLRRLLIRRWPARGRRPDADGELVYAIGDIHGRYDLLLDLLRRIAGDIADRAGPRRPILILCGDYVDRGPDSDLVLEAVDQLRRRADLGVVPLKGNHEAAMLAFLNDPAGGARWLQYGGMETLASYGVAAPGDDAEAWAGASRALAEALPDPHRALLESLQLMAIVGDYAFVHAGVRPGVPLRRQKETDLLWIRDDFLEDPARASKFIVHGHSWADAAPQVCDGRIGIDTGAYETGVLTALRLDGEDQTFIQTGRQAV